MSDDPSFDPTDDPIGEGGTEEERLAREAALVEQTDNGPHEEDGEQDPQMED